MKIHKILTPIATLSVCLSTPIVASTTSCSCSDMSEYENYIYNRTFSIMGRFGKSLCFGTGWIISDATKDVTDDYEYWMATNWHVIHGFDTISASKFYYADNALKGLGSIIDYSDYEEFKSFSAESFSNFTYNEPSKAYFLPCIDFCVAKVKFESNSKVIQSKLDDLNTFQKNNGYINKFVKDSEDVRNKTKYVGGYPMKKSSSTMGGQWESHEIPGSQLDFYEYKTAYTTTASGNPEYGHAVGTPDKDQDGQTITYKEGTPESYYFYDIAPNYVSNKNEGTDFMTGGASGSMLITQDFEVCGIYWGGWGDGDTKFHPSFSLFYNDVGDFISNYL